MKGRLNWAPLRSFDPLILYRAVVRGCVRSLKFKSRKLSPGSGSALQSLLHIPFSPLTDWAGGPVSVNTFAARHSLTCFHVCCPFFLNTFCSSANSLNLVTISALDCMHQIKTQTQSQARMLVYLFLEPHLQLSVKAQIRMFLNFCLYELTSGRCICSTMTLTLLVQTWAL